MRRKLYKHLIETNYRNISSIIKQFKKARKKEEMKKYNVANYIRYKEDLKASMPDDKPYKEYTRNELNS